MACTVDDLIELMGLQAFRDKFVSELSTGSRRIVDLAMSLAHDPAVLLLDEPSLGHRPARDRGARSAAPAHPGTRRAAALLVIEHDMPLITGVSNRMVALDLGRVVTTGSPIRWSTIRPSWRRTWVPRKPPSSAPE